MNKKYPMILAIDTSCDDTSVAVTQGMRILSNVIASQVEIHRKYGGVMPLEAKLAHHELIAPTYKEALKRARITEADIDAVAVTQGPGLAIALEVGIEFAKGLAKEHTIPLIPVNHMKGHLYSCLGVNSKGISEPIIDDSYFPALGLLISGGHTELILMQDIYTLTVVGKTVDDAIGECLDKFARMIDLGYPGAAAMEEIAKTGDSSRFPFPLPMTQSHDFNLSFSGLKTSGRHTIERLGQHISKNDIQDVAASFQEAVFKALLYKLTKAIKHFKPNSLWVGGGVTANNLLKKKLRDVSRTSEIKLLLPHSNRLSSDNAAMIGIAGYFANLHGEFILSYSSCERIPRLAI